MKVFFQHLSIFFVSVFYSDVSLVIFVVLASYLFSVFLTTIRFITTALFGTFNPFLDIFVADVNN